MGKTNFIIVSNRLPLIIKKNEEGKIEIQKGAGGLVTAMAPVLRNRNGTWIGWSGYVQEKEDDEDISKTIQSAISGYRVKPVKLNAEELKNYYEGFSNSILLPINIIGMSPACSRIT